MLPDKRVIACNFTESTSAIQRGSLAYVLSGDHGNGNQRLFLLARSRRGRWVKKWESVKRLCNFRAKTIPPDNPQYSRVNHGSGADLAMILISKVAKE